MYQKLKSALQGPAQARAAYRQVMRQAPSIASGIAVLQSVSPSSVVADEEEPIFLLSAGWRSGSTLLQRLIMSNSSVLVWGEPYDESGFIQGLAEGMKAFRPGWPPAEYYYDGTPPNELTGEWIANLFPSLADMRKAHHAFFDAMFAEPAKRSGATRWGVKEVRLGVEHAFYLRWLYPNARFVLLYRNPLEAYQSYCQYGRSWYNVFPGKPVFTPTAFGQHWRQLMEGFLRDSKALDALVVCYEDLVTGRTSLDELETYLNIHIDRSVMRTKVGSSEQGGKKVRVNAFERWLLKKAVGPIAQDLGYTW